MLLSPYPEKIKPIFESTGDVVVETDTPLERPVEADLMISYGYRHILKGEVLKKYTNRILNLHISLLPWNRGCHPNFWSFFDDTPQGVTLHWIDRGIDTGNLVAQREHHFEDGETLESTYNALQIALQTLLLEYWPRIRANKIVSFAQSGEGTYHSLHDSAQYLTKLPQGWRTKVGEIRQLGRNWRKGLP